jgi:hypothetical protein
MENKAIKNNLRKVVEKYEDVIFDNKKIDLKDFYNVKRLCLNPLIHVLNIIV